MDEKVLIVTSSDEPNVPYVLDFIPKERVFRLNVDELLEEAIFFLRADGARASWTVTLDDQSLSSQDVVSIWYRRPSKPNAPAILNKTFGNFAINEAHKSLMALWSVTPDSIFWMNHPARASNLEFNKPFQCQVASGVGLSVPNTLVTNDPSEARSFFEEWGGNIIIKTFGGVSSDDLIGQSFSVFTNRVTAESLESFAEDIRYSPVMLQNYIPKGVELRITVVGRKIFACAIYSQDSPRTVDDWRRYDLDNVRHEVYSLPDDISDKLLAFMEILGLTFGAIDMIVTPDGEHVFLEVNPSGQWGWIENITGMPIAKSIAETLMSPLV